VKLYKIGEFSKIVNVPPSTLRNWHNKGYFVPHYIAPSKTRYYSSDQIDLLIQSDDITQSQGCYDMVGYCHIHSDMADSQCQLSQVATYISHHATTSVIFLENVAQTHYERLKQVFHMIMANQIKCLVVYDKHVFDTDTYSILDSILKDKDVQLICTQH